MTGAPQQDLLRDPASGAYRLAFLADFAAKELDRARRHGRRFSLAALSLDDMEGPGHAASEGADAAARALVAAVTRVIREADVLARASDVEYRVLLPETDRLGALMFVRRAVDEIRREPLLRRLAGRSPVRVAAGAATFPEDGGDLDQLLRACRGDQAQYRSSMTHRLLAGAEAPGFWDLVAALIDDRVSIAGSASARLSMDVAFLDAVQGTIAREMGRDVRSRGALYAGGPTPSTAEAIVAALPTLEGAARDGDLGARVVLLSPPGGAPAGGVSLAHPLVTQVAVEGDPRLADHRFVLFLSQRSAYALLWRADGRAFHSSDAPLVDLLVARLHDGYELQPL